MKYQQSLHFVLSVITATGSLTHDHLCFHLQSLGSKIRHLFFLFGGNISFSLPLPLPLPGFNLLPVRCGRPLLPGEGVKLTSDQRCGAFSRLLCIASAWFPSSGCRLYRSRSVPTATGTWDTPPHARTHAALSVAEPRCSPLIGCSDHIETHLGLH